jgi:myo-inositol-1(or 4)-monophosphatase
MNSPDTLFKTVMPAFRGIVREAGAIAMRYFQPGLKTSAQVWNKSGGSPVTEADMAVDAFLKTRLGELVPEAGWLSEETADDARRLDKSLVWIVDPIDGTRSFAAGALDWSVSAALLAYGAPVLGIVYAPAHEILYEASRGHGARRDGHRIAAPSGATLDRMSVTGPKALVDQFEYAVGAFHRLPRIPSLALRIARVADGSVDVTLVSSNAHDWDLVAADLILHEAGGRLTGFDGAPPAYNQPEPVHGELVAASRILHPQVIGAMTTRRTASARR